MGFKKGIFLNHPPEFGQNQTMKEEKIKQNGRFKSIRRAVGIPDC